MSSHPYGEAALVWNLHLSAKPTPDSHAPRRQCAKLHAANPKANPYLGENDYAAARKSAERGKCHGLLVCRMGGKPFYNGGFLNFGGRRCRGVTLLELLAAMAILLILAGLVFPMIGKWRESGQRAQCANRVRTLGHAVLLYAADHDMTLPGENISKSAAPRMTIIYQYTALILPYLGLTLEQARVAPQYFRCPSRTNGTVDLPNYIFSGSNELSPSQLGVAGARLASLGQPVRTILLGEAGAAVPFSNHPYTSQNPRPDAKAVLCFVDGHVEFLPIYSAGGAGFTSRENPPPAYGYVWRASLD